MDNNIEKFDTKLYHGKKILLNFGEFYLRIFFTL